MDEDTKTEQAKEREQISRTPPGLNNAATRAWMESVARDQGFTELGWENVDDGSSRLFGVRS